MIRWLMKRARVYREFRRLARSLRFRLALSYAIFFAILVVGVGFILRAMLASSLDRELRQVIVEEWAASKGYMKIENSRPVWFYDRSDPEESLIVNKIKGGVYLLTDANRVVLEMSPTYKGIPISTAEEVAAALKFTEPQWTTKRDSDGDQYLLRQGVMVDSHRQPYYMVIGKPMSDIQSALASFTRSYLLVGVAAILTGGLLGWLMAGRALIPLNSVAQAAQQLKGSNLKVRIPLRGAGDELEIGRAHV